MNLKWEKRETGKYVCKEGRFDAIVRLDGELWKSFVYLDGTELDRGEWDGRTAAFRNARGAIKRAIGNRGTTLPPEDENEY